VHRSKWQNRDNYIQLYIPNRTAIVLCAEENFEKYWLNINGRGVEITEAAVKAGIFGGQLAALKV
jgi:hypothetical protein